VVTKILLLKNKNTNMKNIVGNPVGGNNFFPRLKIENQIYRRLSSKNNIFMSAPRRVGKTSIMYHLRDNPREGFAFLYINTEEISSTEEFFQLLLTELLNSEAVKTLIKSSEKTKSIFASVLENVKKIKFFEVELELNYKAETTYQAEFQSLVNKIEDEDLTIVLMIDEFPTTIENISNIHGLNEAIRFLQINRKIRQVPTPTVTFIYTGSIGLPILVKKMNVPELVNDLNTVEVPELTGDEAKKLAQNLLEGENIAFDDEVIPYVIERVQWLMPFFVQLLIQELITVYEEKEDTLNKSDVDEAYKKIANRRNLIHFASYKSRLADAFPEEENQEKANYILTHIAENELLSFDELFPEGKKTKAENQEIQYIIDTLEFDGYISNLEGKYRFNSPILRDWWLKNCRGK
jgi:uncharacterized protein